MEAKATYCFDGNTMVSYDNPSMAREKAEYVQNRQLGGAMWWESSGDKSGDQSLINTVSLNFVLSNYELTYVGCRQLWQAG